ncbi:dienelactone hydrolase family protein [Paenibacillus xerothermodurans]|uniref:Alpha/beta hydrolase n=1 Tax=Paenibacillus xerothermodurans TaxID=1977292 RepID=A0A2W1NC70_PAEXE|nr:CocE/NonD family hydrolase [Paenibacillus xerothermodurans]PZE22289.1 alpha/beta hydrolase [Paenibacillus xerothermodurans]
MEKELRRKELFSLLGELPARPKISHKLVLKEEKENYVLEKLVLDLNGIEKVPAYFVHPKAEGPFPTILFNHSHGGFYHLGKDEMLNGNVYLQNPPYAEELTKLGYAALCIDMWGFGERRGRTESEIFKHMLWTGRVMWGMMVYDNLQAIDYLLSREDVIGDRIGTLGISLGSTMAWWTAALDTRIKVCVDICCLTDFQALIDSRGLDGHGIYYYVPKLLNHFTTAEINALIAPRAHLSLAGNHDKLTPPAGLDRIDEELKRIYAEEGASDKWNLLRYDVGHFETADMRAEIVSFLNKWL